MEKISVVIADDHPLIIEGLEGGLRRYGIEVVGAVEQASAVKAMYAELKPDILILDINFSGEGAAGLKVAKQILIEVAEARIIFYSQFDQNEVVREAYRIGGAAFITKSTPAKLFGDAIRHVYTGRNERQTYFLPDIQKRMALMGINGAESPTELLSVKELEIFTLMAMGKTPEEISKLVNQSVRTIYTFMQNIKETLGIHRQAEITRLAVKHMLIEP